MERCYRSGTNIKAMEPSVLLLTVALHRPAQSPSTVAQPGTAAAPSATVTIAADQIAKIDTRSV